MYYKHMKKIILLFLVCCCIYACNSSDSAQNEEEENNNTVLRDYVRTPLNKADNAKDSTEEREEMIKKQLDSFE